MSKRFPEAPPPEWALGEWEKALTINVGKTYACRKCRNLVIVTRGGVGVMELVCCGQAMHELSAGPGVAP